MSHMSNFDDYPFSLSQNWDKTKNDPSVLVGTWQYLINIFELRATTNWYFLVRAKRCNLLLYLTNTYVFKNFGGAIAWLHPFWMRACSNSLAAVLHKSNAASNSKRLYTPSLAVGPRTGTSGQKLSKTYLTYDVTHKNLKPKIIFHGRLEDLPSLLRV